MGKSDIKHICIISPSLKLGGIQRELVVLANYYVDKSYEITFITCFQVEKFYVLDKRINLIEHYYKRKNETLLQKIMFYGWLLKYIRREVKNADPDVVLSFGDIMGPLVLGALIGTKFPVFIGDRTSADYKFKWPIPQLKRWLYPKAAGYSAQTSRAANYRKEELKGRLNVRVIPNGIREVTSYSIKKEPIILYVGRFAWEKAPERLIYAFANLDAEDWTLQMAGDGPLLNDMKALTYRIGIADRVIFHGQVKEVDILYAKASIFVIPSILEGFPNALCEAMWAGLPCICFDSIPYEDIFKNGYNGIAVEGGNIEELTKQIDWLIKNPEERERLGENAKEVRTRLTTEMAVNSLFRFMQESLENWKK